MTTGFTQSIYNLISEVPLGKVTTYGDLAALAGQASAARAVGGIAHNGPADLPWHRLVNRFGGLASEFPGGREMQRQLLCQEHVECIDYIVQDFTTRRWSPAYE